MKADVWSLFCHNNSKTHNALWKTLALKLELETAREALFAALDTEAMLTAQPMDAAVMIGGCDKTVPAQLMAAASADIPAVQLVTGPMLATPFQGERLSACTDCRRYWAAYRAGTVTGERIAQIEGRLATTAGIFKVVTMVSFIWPRP